MADTGGDHATFGARFLAEARRLAGMALFDYAVARKLEAMDRAELLGFLRERTTMSYAQLQELKAQDSPEALALFLMDERRRTESLLILAMLL